MAAQTYDPTLAYEPTARPAVVVVKRPVHPMLVLVPGACFAGALITDITYWRTAAMMWANFSAWLISAGVVLAVVALIVWLFDVLTGRYSGWAGAGWFYAIGNIAALIIAVFNMLVHTRDAWTSVVPTGLALSALTVVVLLVTVGVGWSMLPRAEMEIVE